MNASSPFRSQLMQQFAANARNQSRPPLALALSGIGGGRQKTTSTGYHDSSSSLASSQRPPALSTIASSCKGNSLTNRSSLLQQHRSFSATTTTSTEAADSSSAVDASSDTTSNRHHHSSHAQKFQQLISSRRTVSNFIPSSLLQTDRQFIHDAITRGVQCAVTAPNHKITEPTTFHRILNPSTASDRLLDIAFETALHRLLEKKLSGEEACRSEATRKREKWDKIPAFVVAIVSGMNDQTTTSDPEHHKELPYVPPASIQQLEDYASACASVQNLLLSLHSEGLGSKWATGPVIRTSAFRELVDCESDDMIVGLIMIGWPKRLPKLRRRRDIDEVLIDVEYDA